MADLNYPSSQAEKFTISATTTIQLDPGRDYAIDLSGSAGGATAVNIKYQLGDGTYAAYPDDPGAIGSGIQITAPASGVIQIAITGGSSIAIVVSFRRL